MIIQIWLFIGLLFILLIFIINSIGRSSEMTLNYAIFDDNTLVTYYNKFFQTIKIDKENFWLNFQKQYPKEFEKIEELKGTNKSLIINLSNCVSVFVLSKRITIYLFPNSVYAPNLTLAPTQLKEIDVNMSGCFLTDGIYVYRKESIESGLIQNTVYNKCFLLSDIKNILNKLKNSSVLVKLPIAMLVVDHSGNILFCSKCFLDMFGLSVTVKDISDFYNKIRGTIIPDSTTYLEQIQETLRFINRLNEEHVQQLRTLKNILLEVRYIPYNNIIYITYRDITNTYSIEFINSIFFEFRAIFSQLSDGIAEIENGKVVYSNKPLLNAPTKELLIQKLTDLNINFYSQSIKDKRYIVANINYTKLLPEVLESIGSSLNTITKVYQLKKHDVNYLYLIRFKKLHIDNKLLFLDILHNNTTSSPFDPIEYICKYIEEVSLLIGSELEVIYPVDCKITTTCSKKLLRFIITELIIEVLNQTDKCKIQINIENSLLKIQINGNMNPLIAALSINQTTSENGVVCTEIEI